MTFLTNISAPGATDLELVTTFRQSGDMEILGVLYQRYMELVYGVCLKYFKSSEPAKDAVIQIFEELIVKIPKYEIDNFKSWLYILAKNHCLMHLRSPKNLQTVEFNTELMHSAEETHLNGVFEKEETFVQLEQCLEKLTAEQKESVQLFYLEKKCYKEVSGIMNKDINKVRSLIQNGKRNLKICMETNSNLKN